MFQGQVQQLQENQRNVVHVPSPEPPVVSDQFFQSLESHVTSIVSRVMAEAVVPLQPAAPSPQIHIPSEEVVECIPKPHASSLPYYDDEEHLQDRPRRRPHDPVDPVDPAQLPVHAHNAPPHRIAQPPRDAQSSYRKPLLMVAHNPHVNGLENILRDAESANRSRTPYARQGHPYGSWNSMSTDTYSMSSESSGSYASSSDFDSVSSSYSSAEYGPKGNVSVSSEEVNDWKTSNRGSGTYNRRRVNEDHYSAAAPPSHRRNAHRQPTSSDGVLPSFLTSRLIPCTATRTVQDIGEHSLYGSDQFDESMDSDQDEECRGGIRLYPRQLETLQFLSPSTGTSVPSTVVEYGGYVHKAEDLHEEEVHKRKEENVLDTTATMDTSDDQDSDSSCDSCTSDEYEVDKQFGSFQPAIRLIRP